MRVCTKIEKLWRDISENVTQKNTRFWSWAGYIVIDDERDDEEENKDDGVLSQR